MKTGTKEWAETNVNIQLGCEHNCRYCYARSNLVDRFHKCTEEQWVSPVINNKAVDKNRGKYEGTVMFPSSHDITPLNVSQCLVVLRRLLDAGNKVLIVTKPHPICIKLICEAFKEFKKQILFRFTIGSASDEVLKFWEPGAPSFGERMECLKYAFENGFATSVSCEPYLDGLVIYTYLAVRDYLTESFWIGLLRDFDRRTNLAEISYTGLANYVLPLKKAMKETVVRSIYRMLHDKPFVMWKDSIKEMLKDIDFEAE